jgi:hypothetical protein
MTDHDRIIEEAKASVMPFESWERLTGESGRAYAAFCAYRDMGLERNIRKAAVRYADSLESDGIGGNDTKQPVEKRYRMWRNWCSLYRWRERAADYDRYLESLKQTEKRKTIEAQGEKHRAVTGKMLTVVEKKLDLMDPADLTQGAVTEWVETAIRADREGGQFADANCLGVSASRNSTPQPEAITFTPEFSGC